MKVLKFGGSSIKNAKYFIKVSTIIINTAKTEKVAIVLSAPQNITNYLISIIKKTLNNKNFQKELTYIKNKINLLIYKLLKIKKKINYIKIYSSIKKNFFKIKKSLNIINTLKKCSKKNYSQIISKGEKISIEIMKELLIANNFNISIIDPVKNLIIKKNQKNLIINIKKSTKKINKLNIPNKNIILMAGFIAGNKKGETIILGRNGSDYSATALAACFKANICEIWKDVDGIFTYDPNIIPQAYLLPSISYKEAKDLSYFGAKIIHHNTILPLEKLKIPCIIKNTNNLKSKGTIIYYKNINSKYPIKGITNLNNVVIINISLYEEYYNNYSLNKILNIFFNTKKLNKIIYYFSSQNNINFCILQKKIFNTYQILKIKHSLKIKNKFLKSLYIKNNLSIITIIGNKIKNQHIFFNQLLSNLLQTNIKIFNIFYGLSKTSISIIINQKNYIKAIKIAHNILYNINKKN